MLYCVAKRRCPGTKKRGAVEISGEEGIVRSGENEALEGWSSRSSYSPLRLGEEVHVRPLGSNHLDMITGGSLMRSRSDIYMMSLEDAPVNLDWYGSVADAAP